MKILILNAGSSSLKFKLFFIEDSDESSLKNITTENISSADLNLKVQLQGIIERVGTNDAQLKYTNFIKHIESCSHVNALNSVDALSKVLEILLNGDNALISSLKEIEAIGHRIAHGGDVFSCSVCVDDGVIETIEQYSKLAPLHNPSALAVLKECQNLLPHAFEVAAFDTAFHQTMPARNYIYPIPYRYYREKGIRRFGFHGMSHKYVSRRAAEFLGKSPRDLKMITCHLGAGASLTAIDHGISMDTTMGYTPLDGIMMGTRSGSVDPAIITAIMELDNVSPQELDTILNRESGLLGVSGVSGDLRTLKETIRTGDERSELAYDIFLTSIRRMIGAYFFELAGVDVIVCTAGVGENDSYARRLIFRGLEPFGIQIDQKRNMIEGKGERRISTDESSVDVLVIPTDEEAEIARDVVLLYSGIDISNPWV